MATILHHGSNRQKYSTESECIYTEKGSWWHGKCPKQCKPMKSGSIFIEVEKKHQSKNLLRTTMLMGSIPVKVTPHWTLNWRKFVIKCVELDNIDEEELKNELEPHGIIAVKRISGRFSLYAMTIKGQDIPEKNQHWLLEKRNTTLYPQPPKMLPMPEIWTHKKFVQRKSSLCWMWWGRAQCRWLVKWPKMCKLWRRPPCYFERLPNMETRGKHCDPKILRKNLNCWCLKTCTTNFWSVQKFLCICDANTSTICKTSAALGQKHPTSNRFSNRGSIFEIYIKLQFNSVGCYWQWINSCKPHCCHRRSSWKYSYYKYWWYNCTEQQHYCFQWRKQCWHGICCDKRCCNEKKCWWLRWGNKAKCQKDVCC